MGDERLLDTLSKSCDASKSYDLKGQDYGGITHFFWGGGTLKGLFTFFVCEKKFLDPLPIMLVEFLKGTLFT